MSLPTPTETRPAKKGDRVIVTLPEVGEVVATVLKGGKRLTLMRGEFEYRGVVNRPFPIVGRVRLNPPRSWGEHPRMATLICPHRDLSVCPSCAESTPECVEVYGSHYWIADPDERAAMIAKVAAREAKS